jgi:hypothetical protein
VQDDNGQVTSEDIQIVRAISGAPVTGYVRDGSDMFEISNDGAGKWKSRLVAPGAASGVALFI